MFIFPPIFLVIFHFEILHLFCVSENCERVRLDFSSFFLLPSKKMSPDSDSVFLAIVLGLNLLFFRYLCKFDAQPQVRLYDKNIYVALSFSDFPGKLP